MHPRVERSTDCDQNKTTETANYEPNNVRLWNRIFAQEYQTQA